MRNTGREENLNLGKMLNARRDVLVRRTKYFWGRKRKAMAIMTATTQLAKAVIDGAAVLTGLDYRLLRHRALPASPQEIETWERVLDLISKE